MTSRKPRDRYEKLEYALNEIRRGVPNLSMAKDSYQRCTKTPASDTRFFKTFYDEFQRLCPQAKQKFQRLGQKRWQRQHQLLKEAFLMLFVFCEQAEGEEPNILSRVAEMHDHTHHDIPAMFYEPFVDALVHTVCGYPPQIPEPLDPQCVDDESKQKIAQAWRDALAPGIKYMKSKY
jgi:hemoglobin-like flavoprotein